MQLATNRQLSSRRSFDLVFNLIRLLLQLNTRLLCNMYPTQNVWLDFWNSQRNRSNNKIWPVLVVRARLLKTNAIAAFESVSLIHVFRKNYVEVSRHWFDRTVCRRFVGISRFRRRGPIPPCAISYFVPISGSSGQILTITAVLTMTQTVNKIWFHLGNLAAISKCWTDQWIYLMTSH